MFFSPWGNGASGLPTGGYFYFTQNPLSNLSDAVSGTFDHFSGILAHLGVNKPSVGPASTIAFGIFVSEVACGFSITMPLLDVRCIYNFTTHKLSCKFNAKFFTALEEAGKWVFKEATKLFDEAGKEIGRATQDLVHFTDNVAHEFKTQAENDFNKAKLAIKNAATNPILLKEFNRAQTRFNVATSHLNAFLARAVIKRCRVFNC